MSKSFYPIWLPISIIINVILMLMLQFTSIVAAQVPGTDMRISVVNENAKDILLPGEPLQPIAETPSPVTNPGVVEHSKPSSLKNPTGFRGRFDPTKTAKKSSGAGKGTIPSAAPRVVEGNGPLVPTGQPGGIDTGGPGTELAGGGTGGGETVGATLTNKYVGSYPKDALNNNEEGTVVVSVSIAPDGHVLNADISSGSYRLLNNAALRFAHKCSFSPALSNGQQIASSGTITYSFRNGKVY